MFAKKENVAVLPLDAGTEAGSMEPKGEKKEVGGSENASRESCLKGGA